MPGVDEMKQVLVADADLLQRKRAAVLLGAAGFGVRECATAREAQAVLSSDAAGMLSLVLIDLDLPDLPGLELVRWMREQASLQELPVLVGTDRQDLEIAMEAVAAGALNLVRKPYGSELLLRRVTQSLREEPEVSWNATAYVDKEVKRSVRHQLPLSLLLVTGPEPVLTALRPAFEAGLRQSDVAVPVAPGELLLVLPHADESGARRVAVRVHEAALGQPIRLGWASYPGDGDNPDDLLALARSRARL